MEQFETDSFLSMTPQLYFLTPSFNLLISEFQTRHFFVSISLTFLSHHLLTYRRSYSMPKRKNPYGDGSPLQLKTHVGPRELGGAGEKEMSRIYGEYV